MEHDWRKIEKEFLKPFENISYRVANPPKKGEVWNTQREYELLAYIDARDVMERLDAVIGVDGWTDEYSLVGTECVECKLTVLGITKVDVGEMSNFSAEKGGYSDAFKRAAVKFGIGRFLYDLPKKRSYVNTYGQPIEKSNPIDKVFDIKKVEVIAPLGSNKMFCECGREMVFGLTRNGKKKYECPLRDWKKPETQEVHDIHWVNDGQDNDSKMDSFEAPL